MANPNRFYDSPKKFARRRLRFLNKSFQYRYTFYLMGLVTFFILTLALPLGFFLNQNYQIFLKLAFDTAPKLVEHLNRELAWLNSFFFIICATSLITSFYVGIKVTAKLISPLILLERHLRQVSKGSWHIPELNSRRDDEFKELINTYNYFYKSLIAHNQNEFRLLQKISIDPQNREATQAHQELMKIKLQQLGKDLSAATFGETVAAELSRRVS